MPLQLLLKQKTLSPPALQSLETAYHLPQQDTAVRHRGCELTVKYKHTKASKDVESFLQEDQAAGVYLSGELMVSEGARQRQVARGRFELTEELRWWPRCYSEEERSQSDSSMHLLLALVGPDRMDPGHPRKGDGAAKATGGRQHPRLGASLSRGCPAWGSLTARFLCPLPRAFHLNIPNAHWSSSVR